MPILTLLHELGQVIVALIFTNEKVIVDTGNSNLNKKMKLNRLVIKLNGYKSLADVSYGYINWTSLDSNYLINVSLPYILMVLLNALLSFSLFQFLLTILPMKYFYKPYVVYTSDGYKILQHLKNNSIVQRMSRKENYHDNACVENFLIV